jgi:hypothetical protein
LGAIENEWRHNHNQDKFLARIIIESIKEYVGQVYEWVCRDLHEQDDYQLHGSTYGQPDT